MFPTSTNSKGPSDQDSLRIRSFHTWCRSFEQAFPSMSKLSLEDRLILAQPLFSELKQSAENPDDVFQVLSSLERFDRDSVSGHDSGIRSLPGGSWIPPKPLAAAYLDGYDYLAMLHFPEHLYHNPNQANEQLFAAATANPTIRRCLEIKRSPTGDNYGYGRGCFLTFHLYLHHDHWLGLSKSFGCFDITLKFKTQSQGISWVSVKVQEQIKGSVSVTPIAMAQKCKQVVSNSAPRIQSSQKNDTKAVIKLASEMIEHLATTLTRIVDQTDWHRENQPYPNVKYGWGPNWESWKHDEFSMYDFS